jgi:hypothetical protein
MRAAAGEDRMKLINPTTHRLLAIAFCILSLATARFAQTPPAPPAKDKEKEKSRKPSFKYELPPGIELGEGTTSERSILVDPKISISLCVTEGTVSVSGWSRNEVRAFVKKGSKFGFRVLEKSARDGRPVLISLVGLRQLASGSTVTSECIAAHEIELDVPANAAFTLKGRETATTVDTLRKVAIETAGGDISVRNVSQGVRATTFQGDVTVENSEGGMTLISSSGNIIAYGVGPSEVGDAFRAKTNGGSISLQKMEYRLADINSISGSVLFMGELLSGGSFSFNTTNGSIRLMIPHNSSCRLTAMYGFGSFDSDIPLKDKRVEAGAGPVKTLFGTLGAGDCVLRLATNSGAIAIRKQKP